MSMEEMSPKPKHLVVDHQHRDFGRLLLGPVHPVRQLSRRMNQTLRTIWRALVSIEERENKILST